MTTNQWRTVTKLAAKEFACFLMATDEKSRKITLEAMLGCRNPNDEPVDRVYFGWHACYTMPEESLQQAELFYGSCCKLGQWNGSDLADEELKIINQHLEETLTQWQEKLTQAGVNCEFESIPSVANE